MTAKTGHYVISLVGKLDQVQAMLSFVFRPPTSSHRNTEKHCCLTVNCAEKSYKTSQGQESCYIHQLPLRCWSECKLWQCKFTNVEDFLSACLQLLSHQSNSNMQVLWFFFFKPSDLLPFPRRRQATLLFCFCVTSYITNLPENRNQWEPYRGRSQCYAGWYSLRSVQTEWCLSAAWMLTEGKPPTSGTSRCVVASSQEKLAFRLCAHVSINLTIRAGTDKYPWLLQSALTLE